MSYEYSENKLVQDSAGNLLRDELGWDVFYAYNTEKLGVNGTFGRFCFGNHKPHDDTTYQSCYAHDDVHSCIRDKENDGHTHHRRHQGNNV